MATPVCVLVHVSVHVSLRVFSSRYPVPSRGTELVGQGHGGAAGGFRGSGNHPLGQGGQVR